MAYALDKVTHSLALGLRRLRADYAGPSIRVRRSTDNATLDVGFTAAGDLDTDALLAFVGSGDGFVSLIRDQSAFARHASQATASMQPRIVSAGAVETLGGKPAMRFLGGQHLRSPLPQTSTTGAWSVVGAIDPAGVGVWRGFLSFANTGPRADWLTAGKAAALTREGSGAGVNTTIAGAGGVSSAIPALGELFVATSRYGPGGFAHRINGVQRPNNNWSIALNAASAIIGARDAGSGSVSDPLEGWMTECIVVTGNALSDAQAIALEQSQAGYYGISFN